MSEDPERLLGELLSIEANQDQSGATIVLAGEFDRIRLPALLELCQRGASSEAEVHRSGRSRLGVHRLSGLMALARARDAVAEAGVAFRVSASPLPRLSRDILATPRRRMAVRSDDPWHPATTAFGLLNDGNHQEPISYFRR